ncbi:MAG: YcxB family protein [Ruminococcus sp.]|nr:YcxB family protein [Ruminococcus sp.]
MENNYRLEKEYKISFDIFRDGYSAFQKKFVFPQANIKAIAFILLAVIFVTAVIDDNSQYFAYLLIMVCLAMAFREWYNPRKLKRSLSEVFKDTEETVYKLSIGDCFADISTVSTGKVENYTDDNNGDEEILPQKSRIPFDENFSLLEYDDFFLMFSGKSIFYIIPKKDFSEEETEIIRGLKSDK